MRLEDPAFAFDSQGILGDPFPLRNPPNHRFRLMDVQRTAEPLQVASETAGRTLQGYEVMNMIRKGQIHGVIKGDITSQVTFIASLFGVAA